MIEALPFVLQGVVMTVDEFYCHRRRTLRRWERLGHPVDTLAFIGCLAFLLRASPSEMALYVYGGLSVFSSVLITKDEWEHGQLCSGFENWLHALLFVIHPVLLIWAGYLWWTGHQSFLFSVGGSAMVAAAFFVYQTLYWNWWARDRQ